MASKFNRKSTAALLASVTIFGASGAANATTITPTTDTPAVSPSAPAEDENKSQGQTPAPQGNLGENGAGQQTPPADPTAPATPTQTPQVTVPVFTFTDTVIPILEEGSVANLPLVTGADTTVIIDGALPQGVNIVNGALTGTPTTPGDYHFTVKATNTGGEAQHAYTWKITAKPPVFTADPTLPSVEEQTPVNVPLVTGADDVTVTGGALPQGVSIVNGALTGTPTTAGHYQFTVKATRLDAVVTKDFTWEVTAKPLPTPTPTVEPTHEPTETATTTPTHTPTAEPTHEPTATESAHPTAEPTATESAHPTETPSTTPSAAPSAEPTATPSASASAEPSASPSQQGLMAKSGENTAGLRNPTNAPLQINSLECKSPTAPDSAYEQCLNGQIPQGWMTRWTGTTNDADKLVRIGGRYNNTTNFYILSQPGATGSPNPDGSWTLEFPMTLPDTRTYDWQVKSGTLADDPNTWSASPLGAFTDPIVAAPAPTVAVEGGSSYVSPSGKTLKFTGVADRNAVVELVVDGTPTGYTTSVSSAGCTTLQCPYEIDYPISGNPGDTLNITLSGSVGTSNTVTVNIPNAVNPTLSADKTAVDSGDTVHFSGTATPNTTLQLLADGQPLSPDVTIPVGNDGTWSLDHVVTGTAGQRIAFTVKDTINTSLPVSNAADVTINAAPTAPSLNPSHGVTGTTTTIIGGGFIENETVECFIDGTTSLGSTTVGSGGTYTLSNVTISGSEGAHPITCVSNSVTSPGTDFTITATPVPTPHVDPANVVKGQTTTLSGSGFVGSSEVRCKVGSTVVGTVTVDPSRGDWSGPSNVINLDPNGSPYTMVCTDTGTTGLQNSNTLIVTAAPVSPSVTGFKSSAGQSITSIGPGESFKIEGSGGSQASSPSVYVQEPGSSSWVLVTGSLVWSGSDWELPTTSGQVPGVYKYSTSSTGDDAKSITVTSTPAPVAPTVSIPPQGVTVGVKATIGGTGVPGDSIEVTIGTQVFTTTVDPQGKWSIDYTAQPADAGKTLDVVVKDTTNSTQVTGQLKVNPAPSPTPGTITGLPSTAIPGEVIKPITVSGFKPGEVVTFTLMDPEGNTIVVGSCNCPPADSTNNDAANASCSLPDGFTLPENAKVGTWTLTATGSLGTTATQTFQVNGTPTPVAPTVVIPTGEHNVGEPVSISGTGVPGDTIQVWVGGKLVGTVVVDPSGKWSTTYTPTEDQAGKTLEVLIKDVTNGTQTTGSLSVAGKPAPGPTPTPTPTPTPPGPTPGPGPQPNPGPNPNPNPNPEPNPFPWPDNGGNNGGANGGINWGGNSTVNPDQWLPYEGSNGSYTVEIPGFAPFTQVTIELFDANGNLIATQTVTTDANGVARATFTGLSQGVYNVVAHGENVHGTAITQSKKLVIGEGKGVESYTLNAAAPANAASTGITAEHTTPVAAEVAKSAQAEAATASAHDKATAQQGALANTGASSDTAGAVLAASGLAAAAGGTSIMVARRNRKA